MIRVVVIASMKRGAIEPGELLEADDLRMALARLEHDNIWEHHHETVVWWGTEPRVAPPGYKPARSERLPRISQELRSAMAGQRLDLGNLAKNEAARRRMGSVKRI